MAFAISGFGVSGSLGNKGPGSQECVFQALMERACDSSVVEICTEPLRNKQVSGAAARYPLSSGLLYSRLCFPKP